MPTADDLMGFGMPPGHANLLGNQPAPVACLGTALATAAAIKTTNAELIPSSSNTGAVLQASAPVGSPHFLFNAQSTSAVLYVPSGDALNGTTDGTFTLAQNKAVIAFKYKTVGSVGSWSTILTA